MRGPGPIVTKLWLGYYVFFIDDHNHYCWINLMKWCSKFFLFIVPLEYLLKLNILLLLNVLDVLDLDTSTNFFELIASNGTIHKTLCTKTPQQNSVAKWKYRHIIESPIEGLFGHASDYSMLRVFGCTYFVLYPERERSRWTLCFVIWKFLGYG